MIDFNKVITSAMKAGKVLLGAKQTLKASKSGKAAALIVALNCQTKTMVAIQNYSILSNIPFYVYPLTSIELGAVCGKPFPVSALSIRETNDLDILEMKQKLNESFES